MRDSFFITTGADASRCSTGKDQYRESLSYKIPESFQRLLPVLGLAFGENSDLQCCTAIFDAPREKERELKAEPWLWPRTTSIVNKMAEALFGLPWRTLVDNFAQMSLNNRDFNVLVSFHVL